MEFIYNTNVLTELTKSLLFARCMSNLLSAPFFTRDALSDARPSLIHSYPKISNSNPAGMRFLSLHTARRSPSLLPTDMER